MGRVKFLKKQEKEPGPHELIFCPFENHEFMREWAPIP